MVYDFWYMECDGQNFLSFWTIFCPFIPLTTRKINILKKCKKLLELSSFYKQKCTKNHDHMLHCSWDMAHDRCSFYFSFRAIFYPEQPKKSKLKKKRKKAWRYHHFTHVYKKLWSHDVQFPRYSAWRTYRLMEKVTYRGGYPT